MSLWNHLPIGNLIDYQRRAALETMWQEARTLLADGYAVEADRVLDEMAERRRQWEGT